MTKAMCIALLCTSVVTLKTALGGEASTYNAVGSLSCAQVLEAYPRIERVGENNFKGPHEGHYLLGWIAGFATAANRYGAAGAGNNLPKLDRVALAAWVASWCRDNLKKDIDDAMGEFAQRAKSR